jgi:hypothetical protein
MKKPRAAGERPESRRNGAEGIRTPDPHAASVMLSQLSYSPALIRRTSLAALPVVRRV